MESVNVGIIGCGQFSSYHIRELCKFPDVRLVAVCSRNKENALKSVELIHEHGKKQRPEKIAIYTDYHEMVRFPAIDAVTVCTPPPAHAQPMIAAAKAGKHVFCEGPMAVDLEQCDAMIATARSQRIRFTVQHTNRFNKNVYMAKKTLSDGLLGKVLMAKMDFIAPSGLRPEDHIAHVHWRLSKQGSGGGILFHAGRYAIDTFLWLMGDVHEVYGKMESFSHGSEVEDCASATLNFSNGAIGQMFLMGLAPPGVLRSPFYQIEILATKAVLTVIPEWSVKSDNEDFTYELNEKLSLESSGPCDGWASQLRDWIDAIKAGKEPLFPCESFRSQVELARALYKSVAINVPVQLPLQKDDSFYSF
ncbi:MAG: hypothetical protein A2Y13_03880 [Planctomycetes bacterium GWC2_45_44]|nr:MAG: hypothetical protein A2Y13_03880 [Planctomycetes bacterium GWC2_45_44]